jgi:hypothetical protein
MARRTVVRLAIPAAVVGALAVVALWRVGVPSKDTNTFGTIGGGDPTVRGDRPVLEPLMRIADTLEANAIGRQASLENVEIRQVTSATTFWAGNTRDGRVFVVLGRDVRRVTPRLHAGDRLTLIGTVQPAPEPSEAQRQWGIKAATADEVKAGGVFLHATEVRRPSLR